MARTGRPPIDNPRRHIIPIRLTDDEYDAVLNAARAAGDILGPWIRARAVAAARRTKP